MEAAHRTSRISETSQRPKMHSPASSSKLQPPDKRQCRSEVVMLKQGVAGSLKQKNKSASLTTPAKPNIQKGEGTTSSNSRSNMKQKEDDIKSVQLDKKQRSTPKRLQNISKTPRTPEALTKNNQKQNLASQKDRSSLKPRVPCQPRKATSTTDVKSVQLDKKQSTPMRVQSRSKTPRTPEVLTQNNQKQRCASQKDRMSLKPRVPCQPDRKATAATDAKSVQLDRKQRSTPKRVQSRSITPEVLTQNNQKQNCASQKDRPSLKPRVPLKPDRKATSTNGFCREVKTSKKAVETPMIDSDALSALLEQKFKDLSSIVETSQCDTVREGLVPSSASAVPGFLSCLDAVNSASAKHDKMFHLNMQKEKSMIQHDSDASSVEQMLGKAKLELQGMEVSECSSKSETEESRISQGYQQHPCTLSSLETDDSCITSNSTTTLTSNGNKQCTSTRSMELLAEEIELQDSTTSLPNTIFEFTSTQTQWKFDYIKELLIHAELVLSFSHTQKVINPHLFDQLEDQKRNMDPFLKVQRKALFDCVSACLESRCDRASRGGYEEWVKCSMIFQRKDLLADEIQKEISGWTNTEDLMVNEVVDKEITRDGKWLDFKAEALEVGAVVENAILNTLIDEMVTDFLSP